MEAFRQGEPVIVSPTGKVGKKEEMQENGLSIVARKSSTHGVWWHGPGFYVDL